MRIALFHNLPSGGARRAAFELVRHSSDRHAYSYYQIRTEAECDALERTQDVSLVAKEVLSYPAPVPTRGANNVARVGDIRAMSRLQRRIAGDIDDEHYDLVFVHSDRFTHGPALLRFLNTPSLYLLQEPRRQSFEYPLRHRYRMATTVATRTARLAASTFDIWLREQDIRATRAATELMANSYHSLESIYRAYGRHPVVRYLGVDPDVFQPAAGERTGLVAVGALDPVKGHELTVEAVGRVPKAIRPPLTIVFDRERPGVREHLVSLADSRDVELHLRQGIGDDELVSIYQSSLATICAANVEPFGLTTVESLASGTPVVAVNEGGYREVVVHGRNGLLVDRGPDSLAKGIQDVVAQRQRWDPDELRASVLPFFSWGAAAERLDEVFASVSKKAGQT